MALLSSFQTVGEMFDGLTRLYSAETRAMLMYKKGGEYRGIPYSQVRSDVQRLCWGLSALGVKRRDRIAVISENRPEWVIADMAMITLGAVNVSIFPTLTPKQIEFIFNDAGARYTIVSNQLQLGKVKKIINGVPSLERIIVMEDEGLRGDEKLITFAGVRGLADDDPTRAEEFYQDSLRQTRAEDLLTLIYTSGTTGNPKGVMLTHRNLVSNIRAAAECIHIGPDDIFLSFLPLSHSYERMAGYYTAMACGATIAYAESIDTVRENLLEVRPTIVTTVPRLFERMHNRLMRKLTVEPRFRREIFHWGLRTGRNYVAARRKRRISLSLGLRHWLADRIVFRRIREAMGGKVRFFISGGAALSGELGEFFEAVGLPIIEGYGLTETSPVISMNRPDDYKFGTVGKPISGVEVKMADDGEILVRGQNVMAGYWNDPVATGEVIDREGWLHTGDVGMFDDEGFLVITDRKKHLFVSSGGKNIAPQPIENLFLQSKYIDQFVLIGDGRMYLTALVVPEFDVLREYAREHSLDHRENVEEMIGDSAIYKLFRDEIERIQKDLASYERVRRFTLLKRPLTIENGEITPTMKVRRKVVEEKFQDVIEKMYEAAR